MSFFGKKFQKDSSENIEEFFDVLNLDEDVRKFLVNIDAVQHFVQNDDGSISEIYEIDGEQVHESKMTLDEEKEVETPFGIIKFSHTLADDTLNSTVVFGEKELRIERTFEDDSYTVTLSSEQLDVKPVVVFKVLE